jgi:hypothetical protein
MGQWPSMKLAMFTVGFLYNGSRPLQGTDYLYRSGYNAVYAGDKETFFKFEQCTK